MNTFKNNPEKWNKDFNQHLKNIAHLPSPSRDYTQEEIHRESFKDEQIGNRGGMSVIKPSKEVKLPCGHKQCSLSPDPIDVCVDEITRLRKIIMEIASEAEFFKCSDGHAERRVIELCRKTMKGIK